MTKPRLVEDNLELHKNLLRMLDDVIEIFDKKNISYFIAYGTALGAHRAKKIISWDRDIDLCIYQKDLLKIDDIFKSYQDSNLVVMNHRKSGFPFFYLRITSAKYSHYDLHIDIFPLIRIDNIKFHIGNIFLLFIVTIFFKARNIEISSIKNLKVIPVSILKTFLLLTTSNEFLSNLYYYIIGKIENEAGSIWINPADKMQISTLFQHFPYEIFHYHSNAILNGRRVKAPRNLDKYLEILYGDYWIERQY